jgi:SpoVK/Ycf46/Vps4 family AAA+-type ATPase
MDTSPPGEFPPEPALIHRIEWLRRALSREVVPPPGAGAPTAPAGETELRERFGLDTQEIDLLWTLVAAEVDPLFSSLLRAYHTDGSRDDMDGATLVALHGGTTEGQMAVRGLLSPDARVFRHGLVRACPAAHLDRRMRWPLRPAPTCLRALAGEASCEDPLGGVAEWVACRAGLDEVVLPPDLVSEALGLVRSHDRAVDHLREGSPRPEGRGLVLLLTGPSGTGKTLLAEAVSREAGKPLLLVRVDRLVEDAYRAKARLSDIFLEARLHDAIVFLDECDAILQGGIGPQPEHLRELERFDGVTILATHHPVGIDSALQRRIAWVGRLPVPDAAGRERIWRLHLDRLTTVCVDPEVRLESVAGRYELTGGFIRNAANLALHRAVGRDCADPTIRLSDIEAGAAAQLRGDIGEFARSGAAALRLEDLVLPPQIAGKFRELLDACRHHERFLYGLGMAGKLPTGRGIVALLSGDPGTGKTLAAEVLASVIGRPMNRVHLPAVVSRYVGDTEKNIARMFELARANSAILLFDEADSLFSSRVRVESSNDRFANMEVNQLLQEIERHDGIVILTTNVRIGLDNALARRILFRIDFPLPGPEERALIWRRLIPDGFEDPADRIDEKALSTRFDLAGGNIRSAVVRALYGALREGKRLGMAMLDRAALAECEAIGKVVRVKT